MDLIKTPNGARICGDVFDAFGLEERMMAMDYIKREDAVDVIAKQMMFDSDTEYFSGTSDEDLADWIEYAEDLLNDVPSADVVERKDFEAVVKKMGERNCFTCGVYRDGEWIYMASNPEEAPRMTKFCPACGCRMANIPDIFDTDNAKYSCETWQMGDAKPIPLSSRITKTDELNDIPWCEKDGTDLTDCAWK